MSNYISGSPPKYPGKLKKGNRGADVKLLQEMLCLSNFNLVTDGIFGGATENALSVFNKQNGLSPYISYLTKQTWNVLTYPFEIALRPIKEKLSLEELSLEYAIQHLLSGAKELQNQNLGPWVRLYMKGNEGPSFYWCAGFVSFCIKQAAETRNHKQMPLYSFSCDELATKLGKLETSIKASNINKGALFFIRKSPGDWVHTGFIYDVLDENTIVTIEGNTNLLGERDGTSVLKKYRALSDKIDIINFYDNSTCFSRSY